MQTMGKIRAACLALTVFAAFSAARAQDVMIVINRQVSISQITPTELREIFTGSRIRFHDGMHAIPVVLKGGPIHEVFLRHHLDQSPEEFRTLWRKAVFSGQGAMPREFASESAALEYIASTPGAIGYVSHVRPDNNVAILAVSK